jgi:hypothetical protein
MHSLKCGLYAICNDVVTRQSAATRFAHDGAAVLRDLDRSNATIADYLNDQDIDHKLRQMT